LSYRRDSAIESSVIVMRTSMVLVAVVSWVTISNHCALAAFASERSPSQTDCCPHHADPAKQQKQPDVQPCCRILRAIVAHPAKNPTCRAIDIPRADLASAELIIFAPPKISVKPNALDTGPPGAFSFAELILQRSILSHAPPSLA
jgi:hypothetical protein